jgi:hypothetical protein
MSRKSVQRFSDKDMRQEIAAPSTCLREAEAASLRRRQGERAISRRRAKRGSGARNQQCR